MALDKLDRYIHAAYRDVGTLYLEYGLLLSILLLCACESFLCSSVSVPVAYIVTLTGDPLQIHGCRFSRVLSRRCALVSPRLNDR